jgi:microcystin-dependent protein
MATANKGFEQPTLGSIGWGLPLNDDFGGIDAAFGSVTTLSVTGQTATPVVLTLPQYRNLTIKFEGVLTANVTFQLPAGVGGQWVMQRGTTGAFSITIASLGGGTSKILDADFSDIVCDGVDCAGNFGSLPTGSIMIWSGSQATIPVGWRLCDGTLGTPNLLDRFVTGAGLTYAVAATGGANTVTLTQATTPAHVHSFSGNTNTDGTHGHNITDNGHTHSFATALGNGGGQPFGNAWDTALPTGTPGSFTGVGIQNSVSHTHNFTTTSTPIGGDGSHANLPPYYALCYIYKI